MKLEDFAAWAISDYSPTKLNSKDKEKYKWYRDGFMSGMAVSIQSPETTELKNLEYEELVTYLEDEKPQRIIRFCFKEEIKND